VHHKKYYCEQGSAMYVAIRPTRYDDAGLVAVLVVADGRVDSDDNAAERRQPSWRNAGGFDVR
jgi:hypothetical protein